MSEIVYQGVTSAEYLQISSLLQKEVDSSYPKELEVSTNPSITTKTALYGSSLLLAYGSSNKTDRTFLIVKNKGEIQVRIGASSNAAIYEEGIPLEPGDVKVFKADNSISLYARSMGYGAEIEIVEI